MWAMAEAETSQRKVGEQVQVVLTGFHGCLGLEADGCLVGNSGAEHVTSRELGDVELVNDLGSLITPANRTRGGIRVWHLPRCPCQLREDLSGS